MSRNSLSSMFFVLAPGLFLAPHAAAQRWEFGAGGVGSFYTSQAIQGAAGSADASFKFGGGFYASMGQAGNRYGGEVRYSFLMNDMQLKSNAGSVTMAGRTHTFEYDFHYYTRNSEASVRPYIIGGGGIRLYSGAGQDIPIQPTMATAVLTRTNHIVPVLTAGAGVRIAMTNRVFLRTELRAAFSPGPSDVITPTSGGSLGWFVNFMPVVGISYEW